MPEEKISGRDLTSPAATSGTVLGLMEIKNSHVN